MQSKPGFIKPLIVIAICLVGTIGASFYWFTGERDENTVDNQLMFESLRGEFVFMITETGTVESASNFEIKCEVKSRGAAGTAILDIVKEGKQVNKGDFLVQFDDSTHRDRWVEQQIEVAKNKAAEIQAKSDLEAAKKMLEEYNKGTFKQEMSTINAEIAIAQETLNRAREYLKFSEKLNAKSYILPSELEADEFAVSKAKADLRLAKQKLEDLIELTKPRTVEQLTAEVAKLEASLEAATKTRELSEQREKEFHEQVKKCRISAPKAGQVVYANENDRDNSIVIEEGAVIRDGQKVIFLPDPKNMRVRTKVNDSKIKWVKVGDPVEIRLDSEPDRAIKGVVGEVAQFPLPQRWYQAPIEYEVLVDIVDKDAGINSGLRAKSRIIVDRQQNVLQIPASSIVRRNEAYFAIVAENNRYVAREVEVGDNNDKMVIIKSGIEEGEKVLINPEKQKDKVDYPDS